MTMPRQLAEILMRIVAPTGESRYVSLFLASRFVSAGVGAGFGVLSFAVAGASRVGAYAAMVAVCALAGGMAGGWMSQGLIRFHQRCDDSLLRLLNWTSWKGWTFTVSAIVCGSLVAGTLPSAMRSGFLGSVVLASALALAFAMRGVKLGRAMAGYQGGKVLTLELGQALSVAAPPLIVVDVGHAIPFLWRCLIVAIAINIFAMMVSSIKLGRARQRDQAAAGGSPTANEFFRYGAPLGVWIGLSSIYQNADRVMLAWLISDKVAGEYSLIYDISSRGLLLPITALSGAASSAVLQLFNVGDRHGATKANRSLASIQAVILGAMLLPVSAGSVLTLHYVSWFEGRHAVAAVLVYVAASIWACGDTMQRERMGSRGTAKLVYWLALCAGGGVIANLWAIPVFGILGAAGVTLISSAAYVGLVMRDSGLMGSRRRCPK